MPEKGVLFDPTLMREKSVIHPAFIACMLLSIRSTEPKPSTSPDGRICWRTEALEALTAARGQRHRPSGVASACSLQPVIQKRIAFNLFVRISRQGDMCQSSHVRVNFLDIICLSTAA